MGKKNKENRDNRDIEIQNLKEEIELLQDKMRILEQVRIDQVDELLSNQQKLLSDVADLLVRNVGKND